MCWGFPKFGSLYFDRPLTSNLLNLNNEKNSLEVPLEVLGAGGSHTGPAPLAAGAGA